MVKRRETWFEAQVDLDPARLVFIDETWASTNMARRYGWTPKGERLWVGVPHGHWKTTTFVSGLRLSGMVAPMVLDGPINGAAFQALASDRDSSGQAAIAACRPKTSALAEGVFAFDFGAT